MFCVVEAVVDQREVSVLCGTVSSLHVKLAQMSHQALRLPMMCFSPHRLIISIPLFSKQTEASEILLMSHDSGLFCNHIPSNSHSASASLVRALALSVASCL